MQWEKPQYVERAGADLSKMLCKVHRIQCTNHTTLRCQRLDEELQTPQPHGPNHASPTDFRRRTLPILEKPIVELSSIQPRASAQHESHSCHPYTRSIRSKMAHEVLLAATWKLAGHQAFSTSSQYCLPSESPWWSPRCSGTRLDSDAISTVARSEGLVEIAGKDKDSDSDNHKECDAQWLPYDAVENSLARLAARSDRFFALSARPGEEVSSRFVNVCCHRPSSFPPLGSALTRGNACLVVVGQMTHVC